MWWVLHVHLHTHLYWFCMLSRKVNATSLSLSLPGSGSLKIPFPPSLPRMLISCQHNHSHRCATLKEKASNWFSGPDILPTNKHSLLSEKKARERDGGRVGKLVHVHNASTCTYMRW